MQVGSVIEEWREVVNYPRYEVSNIGRVRRIASGRVLKTQYRAGGVRYGYVNLYYASGKRSFRAIYVHRLVAEAFIPNPDNLPLVLHGIEGVLDNSVLNLRWGNNSDNMKDRIRDGTCVNSLKTHCPRNHEYSPDNTSWWRGSRKCRTCSNARRRKKENN